VAVCDDDGFDMLVLEAFADDGVCACVDEAAIFEEVGVGGELLGVCCEVAYLHGYHARAVKRLLSVVQTGWSANGRMLKMQVR